MAKINQIDKLEDVELTREEIIKMKEKIISYDKKQQEEIKEYYQEFQNILAKQGLELKAVINRQLCLEALNKFLSNHELQTIDINLVIVQKKSQ